jgi:2-polyprenyl-6-methoxyphenol hydroxylase-like FAD-dependent oxidoreductase
LDIGVVGCGVVGCGVVGCGVAGCGVAGQAAATFLSEAGHRVTLFERFAEPRPAAPGRCASIVRPAIC